MSSDPRWKCWLFKFFSGYLHVGLALNIMFG